MEHLYSLFLRSEGITTDSRLVKPGMIFFALKGDNFDGNAYANKALSMGALCSVIDDPSVMIGCAGYFLADDVLTTLQELAAYHRSRLNIPIIGLTGSNGKTTTKEFLRLALATKFNVGYTQGNLNNHIGVPLTLLSFGGHTQVGIVEMGANHQGEIAFLCSIVRPDVGLITNVGRAHLEGFGGEDGVRRGKGELFDFLQANGGTAIYNGDDAVLSDMVSSRRGLKFVKYTACESVSLSESIFGSYNVVNALAAITVAVFFGVERAVALDAVRSYVPSNNRSQFTQTKRGNTLIVDCYNANPSSMEVAIGEFLSSMISKPKVLILGEMRELGSYSSLEHGHIMDLLSGMDDVYFVGENFKGTPNSFVDVRALEQYLIHKPIYNKAILLKGSRSVRLEQLIQTL